MAISLLLVGSMLYDHSAASHPVAPAARQEVVRRVADARGWDERAAARFIDTLLRLFHRIGPE